MTVTTKSLIALLITSALFAVGVLLSSYAGLVGASAPSGLPATLTVATTTTVGPQQNITVFAAGECAARIVSTKAQGIMLLFADPTNGDISSTTLSGAVGHWQAGSTTIAYDSGLYGCGRMIGYAGASTTITVSTTR